MRILGLETSCDETAVAIVQNGTSVLANVISSQQAEFAQTGGVIPEEAARKQVECMLPVLEAAMHEVDGDCSQIDAIAVTQGPGLLGSLLTGTTTARVLAEIHQKPLIPVHHTLGHLSSVWLDAPTDDQPQFPCLCLSVSGGHTDLWYRESHTKGELLGRTRDDAAGEAFDKGASLLGLPYPGGPAISRAATGDRSAYKFPRPLHAEPGYDFSFSGLKTALLYTTQELDNLEVALPDLAASYEQALCAHLLDRLERAANDHPAGQEIHIVGGVSANRYLREQAKDRFPDQTVRFPLQISYCTDNAAMIAAAGYFWTQENGLQSNEFTTTATLPLFAQS